MNVLGGSNMQKELTDKANPNCFDCCREWLESEVDNG